MDFGFEAHYMGVRYPAAVGPENEDITLFTDATPEMHLGFKPGPGYWLKHVRRTDIQGLALIRTFGSFRGDRCFVLERTGDQLHIAYAGHDAYHAEHLGYWMVDRGVYEAVVPSSEVTETWVERIDLPAGPATAASTAAQGIAPGLPAAQGTAAPAVSGSSGQPSAVPPPPGPLSSGQPAPAQPVTAASAAFGDSGSGVPVPPPELPQIPELARQQPVGSVAPGNPLPGITPPLDPTPGQPRPMTLMKGTLIDRYGPEQGRLVFAKGTPFEQRSLPVAHREYACHAYRVITPSGLAVRGGPVAPWFGQPGGGEMYELPRTVEELIDLSALERVEEAP
jgi:Tuberculosis necrotizing toxin